KPETIQRVPAIVGEGAPGTRSESERREHGPAQSCMAVASPAQELERPLVALGEGLFAHTGGHPLYLLETLKLLREREWLVPRLAADGTWRLEPTREMAAFGEAGSRRAPSPPSVRTLLLARL